MRMNESARILKAAVVAVLAVGAVCAGAQAKSEKTPLPELWTALETKLDATKLKEGDTVAVRVIGPWVYRSCGIAEGVKLKGKVVKAKAWEDGARWTELSLEFEGVCADGKTVPLILMAVFYPEERQKTQMDEFNAMPQGIGAGASGRQSTNLGTLPSPGQGGRDPLPLAKMGEVERLGHLTLAVAKGPGGSTTMSVPEKKLRLDAATRLAMVPVPR